MGSSWEVPTSGLTTLAELNLWHIAGTLAGVASNHSGVHLSNPCLFGRHAGAPSLQLFAICWV